MTIVPAYLAAYGDGGSRRARCWWPRWLRSRRRGQAGRRAAGACGAPLEVAAEAVVARCLYCGAENALQAPVQLKAARASGTKVARTMREAAERDRHERQQTRV